MAENGRREERESSGHSSGSDDLNHRVHCEYCGNALRRLPRHGFMQKEVYSWFGYYPWECPLCREKTLVRQQHRLKKRSEGEQHEAQRT
jgi:DNA-directed RNA polymerase subunit RPC12/RpoP